MQYSMMSSETISFINDQNTSSPNEKNTRSNMQVLTKITNPTITPLYLLGRMHKN